MENIAEILRDCPKGTKLYSPIFGEATLDNITSILIVTRDSNDNVHYFYTNGKSCPKGECVLFPSKENRDWSKFQRPFKDGDIVFYSNTIAIFKEWGDETLFRTYCEFYTTVSNPIYQFEIGRPLFGKGVRREARFATEGEKEKLFKAIKDNGYRWNPETKILEKLVKFKVGDRVKKNKDYNSGIVTDIFDDSFKVTYNGGCCSFIQFHYQYEWELVPDVPKFKVGDVIQDKDLYKVKITEVNIEDECYGYESVIAKGIGSISFSEQDNWEMSLNIPKFKVGDRIKHKKDSGLYCTLGEYAEGISAYRTSIGLSLTYKDLEQWDLYPLPDKFDISTLEPFESKVLVRDYNSHSWKPAFFGFIKNEKDDHRYYVVGGISFLQCIPYEGNEHLRGTANDCEEFYKTW